MKGNAAIPDEPGLEVDVVVGCGTWNERQPAAVDACTVAARAVQRCEETAPAAVCVLLTDDAHMREMNARFRGVDRPTNVLSFAAGDDDAGRPADLRSGRRVLGDLALGLETVEREAAVDGKTVLHHLQHLVIHGMLHLLGYDHETDADAQVMERKEVEILAALGIGDPYGDGDRR